MVGRIPVLDVKPQLECGSHPTKAAVGEPFEVSATVIREGHDALNAEVVLVDPQGQRRPPRRMHRDLATSDRWAASVVADQEGPWSFEVHGWSDPVATWRHNAEIKVPAGIDVELELTEGALVFERAAKGLQGAPRKTLEDTVTALRDTDRPAAVRLAAGLAPEVTAALAAQPLRDLVTVAGPYPFFADRQRALYGSWYEFFPRSEGAYVDDTGKVVSGTFQTAAKRLVAVVGMGFDVIYLPPIHPIGEV